MLCKMYLEYKISHKNQLMVKMPKIDITFIYNKKVSKLKNYREKSNINCFKTKIYVVFSVKNYCKYSVLLL